MNIETRTIGKADYLVITAEEGFFLKRKADGAICGKSIALISTWWKKGIRQEKPFIEKPIDYAEISEIDLVKEHVIKSIDDYDKSNNVNSFYLNGNSVWLDRETRVSLMNSVNIVKMAGKNEITLWFEGLNITVDCDTAIQLLSALEVYALECYNVTARHKVEVENMLTLEDVRAFDITDGYPQKLNINI